MAISWQLRVPRCNYGVHVHNHMGPANFFFFGGEGNKRSNIKVGVHEII